MRVFVVGDSEFGTEFAQRIAQAGHEVLDHYADIDLTVDCCVQTSSKAMTPGGAPIYSLCYSNSASHLAYYAGDSEKYVGFSLVPPVTDSSILELARPLQASQEAFEEARAFFESLGFEVVEVPDGPGLVAARVVACLANEAFSALAEGVADARTIDTAMRLGTNYPRGPLEWADLIGLPSVLAVLEGLFGEYGEDRYRPHPLLKRLVAAGMSVAEYEARRGS